MDMSASIKPARVNSKLLFILVFALIILTAGAFLARQIRRQVLTAKALSTGHAAFDRKDWQTARRNFREYLARNPEDLVILPKYAQAELSVDPLTANNIGAAINAYRLILRLNPGDEKAARQLATLYLYTGDFNELAYIAQKRLNLVLDDPQAGIWLAKARIARQELKAAQKNLQDLLASLKGKKEKKAEFVEASMLLSGLLYRNNPTDAGKIQAMQCLDEAVRFDPQSPWALLTRAKFVLTSPKVTDQERKEAKIAARKDLEKADALKPRDPILRLALCEQWNACGEPDRAVAELQTINAIAPTVIKEFYIDPNDWVAEKFVRTAETFLRKNGLPEMAAQTDKILSTIKEKRHRFRVLPIAIRTYVKAGRITDARKILNEYLDISRLIQSDQTDSDTSVFLQAIVARAEGNMFQVTALLEPVITRTPSQPEPWKMLAEAYSVTGQTRRAIRVLRDYLRLQPGDKDTLLQLTREYIRQRDWTRAQETARQAETLDPTNPLLKLLRTEADLNLTLKKTGNSKKEALDSLSKKLTVLKTLYPDKIEVPILQSIIDSSQDNFPEAEKKLKHAIEKYKDPMNAELQLAQLYLKLRRLPEAIMTIQALSKKYPQSAAVWESLADIYLTAGRIQNACNALETAVNTITDRWEHREVEFNLAYLELTKGKRQVGLDLLRKMAAEDENDLQARSVLLRQPEILRNPADAQKLVDEIHRIEGDTGSNWRFAQAYLWWKTNPSRARQKDIIGLLNRCIETDPEWDEPILLLAEIQEKLGNLPDAEEIYRRGLATNPSSDKIAGHLAAFLDNHLRFTEAKEVLEKLDASSPSLDAGRIITLIGTGDFKTAINDLTLWVANNPRDVNSRITLARLIYRQKKDAIQAQKYLDEALAINPNSLLAMFVKVSILQKDGKTDQARKLLDNNVNGKKDFPSYLLRGIFLAENGNLAEAQKDFIHLTTLPGKGEGYLTLGNFYALVCRRLDDAVAAWEKGLKTFPENKDIKRCLMKALLDRNQGKDRDRALRLLDDLQAQAKEDPELLWCRAMVLLDEKSNAATKTAMELIRKVIEKQPAFADAHLKIIQLDLNEGNLSQAREDAIRAQNANPTHPDILLARAGTEIALNNPKLAHELVRPILKDRPGYLPAVEIFVRTALAEKDQNALKEAGNLIKDALTKNPVNDRLQVEQALILQASGKPDHAVENLEKYLQSEKGKKSFAAMTTLAEFYRLGGNMDKCSNLIARAEELDPRHPVIIRQKILLLGEKKKFEELVTLVSSHLEKNPKDIGILRTAAGILAVSNIPAFQRKGMEYYEKILLLNPAQLDAYIGLAWLAYQRGEVQKAETLYRKALALNPNQPQVLNDLAWIMADLRHEYQNALILVNKALKLNPDNPDFLDTRGVILAHLPGRLRDARTDLEKCVHLTAQNPPVQAKALLHLAKTCLDLKDFDLAKKYLTQAQTIDRKSPAFNDEERSDLEKMMTALSPGN